MSTKIIDQKAYLQKYLSGPSADKKKKKKKVVRGSGFSIIDDDLDLSKMRTLDDDELEVLDGGDDAPQIAGIIDERPEELKILEQFKAGSKWRIVNQDDGFSSKLQIEEVQIDVKKKKKENELMFGKLYSDSEDEDAKNGSDLSPPRVQHTDYGKPDKKHSTKRRNHSDNDSDSDLSPIRKKNKKLDSNKRTKRAANSSDSDLSPPRRKDTDKNHRDAPKEKRSKPSRWDTERYSDSPPPTNKKMARTLEGKLAGLQDATQLRQENESFRRREDDAFQSMADEVSGRNAQAVSRKSKRETSEDRQKQREKADRQKELDDKYKRWGRGLKQLEEREARAQHFAHEAAKPLARLAGDCDLEAARRRAEHEGDPMLQYLRDRRRELRPELPKYKGDFPPNRFAIPPGYRWDGVDRSNGYEKKYFAELSNRRAREEEAFKWSTADL